MASSPGKSNGSPGCTAGMGPNSSSTATCNAKGWAQRLTARRGSQQLSKATHLFRVRGNRQLQLWCSRGWGYHWHWGLNRRCAGHDDLPVQLAHAQSATSHRATAQACILQPGVEDADTVHPEQLADLFYNIAVSLRLPPALLHALKGVAPAARLSAVHDPVVVVAPDQQQWQVGPAVLCARAVREVLWTNRLV